MSHHRYPRSSLLADYGRALAGLVVTGIPIVAANMGGWVGLLIGALAALFVVYGLRTAIRHLTTIDVSEIGIRTIGPMGREIPWEDLQDVRLKYFATRRDRRGGWMQLKVTGARGSIGLDSSLDGFDAVLEHVVEAATQNRIELNEDTRENLQQLAAARAKAQ